MTTPTENKAPIKLQRPSEFHNTDGFLSNLHWDTGRKGALAFFFKVDKDAKGKIVYSKFKVRINEKDAYFMEMLFAEKKKQADLGQKYTVLINMDLKAQSWERKTGEMTTNNKPKSIVEYYFKGKNLKMMNPSSYEVMADSAEFVIPELMTA